MYKIVIKDEVLNKIIVVSKMKTYNKSNISVLNVYKDIFEKMKLYLFKNIFYIENIIFILYKDDKELTKKEFNISELVFSESVTNNYIIEFLPKILDSLFKEHDYYIIDFNSNGEVSSVIDKNDIEYDALEFYKHIYNFFPNRYYRKITLQENGEIVIMKGDLTDEEIKKAESFIIK